MKSALRNALVCCILLGVHLIGSPTAVATCQVGTISDSDRILDRAFKQRKSNIQVDGRGSVKRLLADDNDGSRHQRFILELATGQTLLVSHNISLAPRVAGLKQTDTVEFNGEYAWNKQGGVIHWTHKDPGGKHPNGWLKHKGKTYQ